MMHEMLFVVGMFQLMILIPPVTSAEEPRKEESFSIEGAKIGEGQLMLSIRLMNMSGRLLRVFPQKAFPGKISSTSSLERQSWLMDRRFVASQITGNNLQPIIERPIPTDDFNVSYVIPLDDLVVMGKWERIGKLIGGEIAVELNMRIMFSQKMRKIVFLKCDLTSTPE